MILLWTAPFSEMLDRSSNLWKRTNLPADWLLLPFQFSPHVLSTSMCAPAEAACQPACDVTDMTTASTARMRSAPLPCSATTSSIHQISLFQIHSSQLSTQTSNNIPSKPWCKGEKLWHRFLSVLTDRLRERVPGGRVPLSEPSTLHPTAVALRRRLRLYGPQRRGKLQPG